MFSTAKLAFDSARTSILCPLPPWRPVPVVHVHTRCCRRHVQHKKNGAGCCCITNNRCVALMANGSSVVRVRTQQQYFGCPDVHVFSLEMTCAETTARRLPEIAKKSPTIASPPVHKAQHHRRQRRRFERTTPAIQRHPASVVDQAAIIGSRSTGELPDLKCLSTAVSDAAFSCGGMGTKKKEFYRGLVAPTSNNEELGQERCSRPRNDRGNGVGRPPQPRKQRRGNRQGKGTGPVKIWCCPSTSVLREEACANLNAMTRPGLWREQVQRSEKLDAGYRQLERLRESYKSDRKVGAAQRYLAGFLAHSFCWSRDITKTTQPCTGQQCGPAEKHGIQVETRISCSGKKRQQREWRGTTTHPPPQMSSSMYRWRRNVIIRACATCFKRVPSYILHLTSWGGICRPRLLVGCSCSLRASNSVIFRANLFMFNTVFLGKRDARTDLYNAYASQLLQTFFFPSKNKRLRPQQADFEDFLGRRKQQECDSQVYMPCDIKHNICLENYCLFCYCLINTDTCNLRFCKQWKRGVAGGKRRFLSLLREEMSEDQRERWMKRRALMRADRFTVGQRRELREW